MKKFLFLLIVLAAAVYWGFSIGSPSGDIVRSQPSSVARSSDSGVVEILKDSVSSLFSNIEKKDTPAASSPKAASSEGSEEESLLQKWNDITHFKEALEKRVDRKNFVPFDEIPDYLKKGIIATEDRRYYEHGAIDVIGVTRAMITNALAGQTLEGGSTIAQQTVKNIFLSNERTMSRKIEELALAVQLEHNYSKDEILELYLNTIYFGHGAYGLEEASHTYFGKAPMELDLAQCAMLAGLPQAPSAYDPIDHPTEGAKRMTTVLALMAQEGYITPGEAAQSALHLWLK